MSTKIAPWPRRGSYRVEPGLWFVPSRTIPGVFYRVEWHHDAAVPPMAACTCPKGPPGESGDHTLWCRARRGPKSRSTFTCSCRAGVERGRMDAEMACRHVKEAAKAEQDDGVPPRPLMALGDVSRFTE